MVRGRALALDWPYDADAYLTYLESKHWATVRDEALRVAGYSCQLCNIDDQEAVLDVHHRTYERLGNEDIGDLTVLCRDCHRHFHGEWSR